jgi:mono/diheme cytochrome c family protein
MKFAILAAAAIIAIGTVIAVGVPRSARALPAYAAETGKACGVCHVDPAGGGPRTPYGDAFAANGHKLPKE